MLAGRHCSGAHCAPRQSPRQLLTFLPFKLRKSQGKDLALPGGAGREQTSPRLSTGMEGQEGRPSWLCKGESQLLRV